MLLSNDLDKPIVIILHARSVLSFFLSFFFYPCSLCKFSTCTDSFDTLRAEYPSTNERRIIHQNLAIYMYLYMLRGDVAVRKFT